MHDVRPRKLPPRRQFLRELLSNALFGLGFVAVSLAIGAAGYHIWLGLGWLDATLNASMILTGMGPLTAYPTRAAKMFGIGYTLFSGVAFLTTAALLFGPVVARFMHRFHLDLYGERN
jgi:hypothetical protein